MLPVYFIKNKYYFIYYKIISRSKSRIISGYVEKHHIIPKSLGGTNDKSNIAHLTAKEHFICHRLLTKFTTGKNQLSMSRAAWRLTHSNFNHQRIMISPAVYEKLKIKASQDHGKLMTGIPKSEAHKAKLSKIAKGRISPNRGKKYSDEYRMERSKIMKEKYANGALVRSPETIEKHRLSMIGRKHSEETKKKISESNKGKAVIVKEETKVKISETLKERYENQTHHLKGRVAHNKGKARTEEEKAKMSAGHQNRERVTCEHCYKSIPKSNYSRWHGLKCKLINSRI